MAPRPGLLPVLLLTTITLGFLAGCGESSTTPTDGDPTGPGGPVDPGPSDPSSPWQLPPDETAEALTDPERVEDGVRSILANLGIGVYGANGTQVFAGSETSALDFWLYDFEIPILARGALEAGAPFTRLADAIASAGASVTAEGLLAHYRDAYAAHPDAFLVALLDETGLSLAGSPELVHLTPLQEWLLLLDAFVPPPAGSGSAGAVADGAVGESLVFPAQTSGCAAFQGAGLTPGWGIAGPPAQLPAQADPTTMLQLVALRQMLVIEVRLSDDRAHHLHPGGNHDVPPHTMVLAAVVGFDSLPAEVLACRPDLWGSFTGLTPGSDGTWGMPDVVVQWELDFDFFEEHGTLETDEGGPWFPGLPTSTASDGRAELHFIARDEETRGLGIETEDSRTVSATLQVGDRLQQIFPIEYPTLIGSFFESVHRALPQPVTVEWHEGFELEVWAGWSTDAIAVDGGAIAGAETQMGHNPRTSARSPLDLPELDTGMCGMFAEGLAFEEGIEIFQADASAGGQTAWMQTTVERPEEGFGAAISFVGQADARAVSHGGSWAEAATESLDDFGFDPAVYVFNIENPGADTLQFNVTWEYEGEVAGEPEYSQWWVDAFLRIRSCDQADGGPNSQWATFLGYDDEYPGPGSGLGQEILTEELVQVQIVLMAGVLANAFLPEEEPPVESSASVEGSLRISFRSIHDPGGASSQSASDLSSSSNSGAIERTRQIRGPR